MWRRPALAALLGPRAFSGFIERAQSTVPNFDHPRKRESD
jgi:hypothetical protein